jgi:hypothetical protein
MLGEAGELSSQAQELVGFVAGGVEAQLATPAVARD